MTSPSSAKVTNSVASVVGGISTRAPVCRPSPYLVRISASALWVMRQAYAARLGRSIAACAIAASLSAAACGGGTRAGGEDQAAALAPATARLLARARVEERARRYDRARALYQQAADQAPDRSSAARAWRELGRALAFWGETDAAALALARAVELAPGDVSAWHDLGIVRDRRGDPAGAERALRRAITLAPREPRPRIALGALLVNQHRWHDALAEYRALEELDLPEQTRSAVARAIALIEAEQARPPR
jgi:Flp pilus assembly protein TadD